MSDDPVLVLDAVTRTFGSVVAVDGLSERFRRGEYFCVLGPSGCGKTTLLRLIAGFEVPDTGEIRLLGRSVAGVPPERRDVNVVFQSYALFPHLSVRDNIGFGLRMKRLGRAQIRERVDDAVRLVHLEAEADRLPRQLSGGQQQRVALARALVNRPAVLLLDEPLSALDASLRQRMQDELRALQRQTGVTFIHITHDQAEALSLADRVAVMRAGRFEQVASPHDVYLAPATAFVARFVGATNLLSARLADERTAMIGGAALRLPQPVPFARAGDSVVLAVRPERVRLGAADAELVLRGRVVQTVFAGATHECVLDLDGLQHPLRLLLPPDAEPVPANGQSVVVGIAAADVVVLPPEPA
jgi:spermidine/putrescine transport system ATP-binding protein